MQVLLYHKGHLLIHLFSIQELVYKKPYSKVFKTEECLVVYFIQINGVRKLFYVTFTRKYVTKYLAPLIVTQNSKFTSQREDRQNLSEDNVNVRAGEHETIPWKSVLFLIARLKQNLRSHVKCIMVGEKSHPNLSKERWIFM